MSIENHIMERFYHYGRKIVVKKGQVVYNSNMEMDNRFAYFLEKGCCALSGFTRDGEERTYLYFNGKRTIGFAQMMPSIENHLQDLNTPFIITAKTDCVLYQLTKETFMLLLQNDRSFLNFMLKVLSENYLDMLVRYHTVQDDCATVRLCQLFLEFAEHHPNGLELPSFFTQVELSHYLGTHVVTISRIISQLKQRGYIEKKGRRILIKDRKGLEELIDAGANFDF